MYIKCEILGSYTVVGDDSSFMGCDAVSLGR